MNRFRITALRPLSSLEASDMNLLIDELPLRDHAELLVVWRGSSTDNYSRHTTRFWHWQLARVPPSDYCPASTCIDENRLMHFLVCGTYFCLGVGDMLVREGGRRPGRGRFAFRRRAEPTADREAECQERSHQRADP